MSYSYKKNFWENYPIFGFVLYNSYMMEIKVCRKCQIVLTKENRYLSAGNICKECEKERMKEYRQKFPEKRKETKDKWNRNNPEKKKELKKAHHKRRLKKDTFYKFTVNMRNNLTERMKKKKFGSKDSSFYRIIGLTPPELREHIEKQFKEGMTWENHGWETWHLDHIIPLSCAKNKEEYYKLWHYTNLQPLWKEENESKGNKVL